jgi:uncharacterized protein (TIGR04141 family)
VAGGFATSAVTLDEEVAVSMNQQLPDPTTPFDAESDDARLDQVNVFLVREEIGEPSQSLTRDLGEPLPVHLGDLDGEFYLSRGTPRVPRWLPFVRSVTGDPIPYEQTPSLSGVLFLRRRGRILAVTFGYGRHVLQRSSLEADFGLKVAAGLIDPDEIAVLDARSVEATSIQVRRQSSRGVTAAAIGFNVSREMLRAIAGPIADEELGSRIIGSDGLALTARLRAPELGPRLDRILGAYRDGLYAANFAHIDRWSEVPPGAKRSELDEALVATLARRWQMLNSGEDPASLPGVTERPPYLEAPEVLGWESAGFRTTPESESTIHAFPSLDAYLEALDSPPTLRQLRNRHRLSVVSDIDGAIVTHWPIHGAILWEQQHGQDTFVLAEGRWWRIDADYRARIDEALAQIPEALLPHPDFDPIEEERDYNLRLADYPDRILLDRRMTRFTYENGTVEACDVLTLDRQLVHVKSDATSAMLSHLYAQAVVSARLFLMLPEFREQIRRVLDGNQPFIDCIPLGRPDPRDYEVVLAIVRSGVGPLGTDLPFFARNNLVGAVADLQLMGYRVGLVRIAEREGARPPSAGPLQSELDEKRKTTIRMRSTRRGRRAKAVQPSVVTLTPA